MKPFFTFLVWAAILLSVAFVPFVPLEYRSVREVIRTTWSSGELAEQWWSRKLSWAGGPVWRYAGALLLGYRLHQTAAHEHPLLVPDITTRTFTQDGITYAYDAPLYPSLAVPHLGTLAVVFFALFITLIALAMIFVVVRNICLGTSAIQIERTRLWRTQDGGKPVYDARVALWVPIDADSQGEQGAVVFVEPDTLLFDLGAGENWRRVMGEKWLQWFVPRASDLHDLNPRVVDELRERARKKG
ncbi:proteophosphoglycan ppg4 [Rhodotorula toruloides]|uniref:Proteophosphoglycan ppg4 n=1 Tax=Rhodotorula toruloides TaxID=5286 RepID=A0A511K729_RHOTO|nr:proteophosphoglycan ppg4 [Rhodotorula toruloides]